MSTAKLMLGDLEVEVDYTYYKGDPGRVSGPPERCYPPEPAYAEIVSVNIGGVALDPELFSEAVLERWDREICEAQPVDGLEDDRRDDDDDPIWP